MPMSDLVDRMKLNSEGMLIDLNLHFLWLYIDLTDIHHRHIELNESKFYRDFLILKLP